jgi:hypothetical protein
MQASFILRHPSVREPTFYTIINDGHFVNKEKQPLEQTIEKSSELLYDPLHEYQRKMPGLRRRLLHPANLNQNLFQLQVVRQKLS